jgi:hypothetical protein
MAAKKKAKKSSGRFGWSPGGGDGTTKYQVRAHRATKKRASKKKRKK